MESCTEASPLLLRAEGADSRPRPLLPATNHTVLRYAGALFGLLVLFPGLLWTSIMYTPAGSPDILAGVLPAPRTSSIRVAFAGNSMMYYQDLPRLLQQMLQTRFKNAIQDSCFQGVSTIPSLWTIGSTVVNKTLHTEAARQSDGSYDIGAPTVQALLNEQDWDFLVMNDFTQSPARRKSREESKKALEKYYAPILKDKGTELILLETAAYEIPNVHNTSDLGDFDEFTRLLHEGYVEYILLMQQLHCSARLAPNALAFSYVRYHKPELFHILYAPDHHHPSPHGTWMEACVIYCTMLGEMPPRYDAAWWKTARYVVPGLPFPTDNEAEQIRQVAGYICEL